MKNLFKEFWSIIVIVVGVAVIGIGFFVSEYLDDREEYFSVLNDYKTGDYVGACEYPSWISEDDYYYSQIKNIRGLCGEKLGYLEYAIKAYDDAIASDPEYSFAYINRAKLKVKLNKNKGAMEDFNKAIEVDSDNITAWISRGDFKASLMDNVGAVEDFSNAIKLDSKSSDAYFKRGICRMDVKDYKNAIADFNQVTSLKPKHLAAYLERSKAKLKLGDKGGACLDLSKAGELGSEKAYELIRAYCN